MDTQVQFQEVSKIYENGATGLGRINLRIRRGEFVVLVGPSGCGKSTLLRCLAGLESPTFGNILITNRKVNALPPAERGVGMVFQDYALYPHMNVRENLAFGLKMRKLPGTEISRRIEETAEMLGLAPLLERKPTQLSGGQRQRVAIGRALIKRPEVLLLDEPLSNLDAQLRARTRVEIAALHRRTGATTLYVTHDQEEAMTLADRIVVLDHGEIQQVDTPERIYQDPENRFVASFIGTPAMNFLEGELRSQSGEWTFQVEHAPQTLRVTQVPRPTRTGPVLLGFRPEAARVVPGGSLAGADLVATFTWLELHGHEVQLLLRVGTQVVTLRISEPEVISQLRKLAPEAPVALRLDRARLHWFEVGARGLRIQELSRQAA